MAGLWQNRSPDGLTASTAVVSPIRSVSVTPRGLRISVAHEVGNGRFIEASLSERGADGVTQIVPMQIVDSN